MLRTPLLFITSRAIIDTLSTQPIANVLCLILVNITIYFQAKLRQPLTWIEIQIQMWWQQWQILPKVDNNYNYTVIMNVKHNRRGDSKNTLYLTSPKSFHTKSLYTVYTHVPVYTYTVYTYVCVTVYINALSTSLLITQRVRREMKWHSEKEWPKEWFRTERQHTITRLTLYNVSETTTRCPVVRKRSSSWQTTTSPSRVKWQSSSNISVPASAALQKNTASHVSFTLASKFPILNTFDNNLTELLKGQQT